MTLVGGSVTFMSAASVSELYRRFVAGHELIGGDPLHRLGWGDEAGWVVERADGSGHWVQVAAYGESPPLVARHFSKWLSSQTGLTFDQAEDAVLWLREQSPSRFVDPHDEPDGGGG